MLYVKLFQVADKQHFVYHAHESLALLFKKMTEKESPTRLRRELASLFKQKHENPQMLGSTRPSMSFLGQAFCDKSLSVQKAGLDTLTP